MVDGEDADTRVAALEGRIKRLEMMLRRLLPAVLDTAHQTGVRRRHVLLTIEAVKTGMLSPDEFDSNG